MHPLKPLKNLFFLTAHLAKINKKSALNLSYQIDFQRFLSRAVNEARTRDPQLGKLVLYQLSYYRIFATFLGSKAL